MCFVVFSSFLFFILFWIIVLDLLDFLADMCFIPGRIPCFSFVEVESLYLTLPDTSCAGHGRVSAPDLHWLHVL